MVRTFFYRTLGEPFLLQQWDILVKILQKGPDYDTTTSAVCWSHAAATSSGPFLNFSEKQNNLSVCNLQNLNKVIAVAQNGQQNAKVTTVVMLPCRCRVSGKLAIITSRVSNGVGLWLLLCCLVTGVGAACVVLFSLSMFRLVVRREKMQMASRKAPVWIQTKDPLSAKLHQKLLTSLYCRWEMCLALFIDLQVDPAVIR